MQVHNTIDIMMNDMSSTSMGYLSVSLSKWDKASVIGNGTFSPNFRNLSVKTSFWTDPLIISQLVTIAVGIITNIGTVITFWKNGKAFSPLILALFRHQSIIDAILCVICGITVLEPPNMRGFGMYYIDIAICHLWHSAFLYVSVLQMSVWNLVFIALERFLAVCKPFIYQQFRTKTLNVMMVVLIIVSLLINPPIMFQTKYENRSCFPRIPYKSEILKVTIVIYSVYLFLALYLIPTICFLLAYGIVIYKFRKRGKSRDMAPSRVIDKATKELTKTALVVTMIFFVSMGIEHTYFLLANTQVVKWDVYGFWQEFGWLLMSINSATNPFVYTLLMPVYRQCVWKTFCGKCALKE